MFMFAIGLRRFVASAIILRFIIVRHYLVFPCNQVKLTVDNRT